jgi:hypothetical protein
MEGDEDELYPVSPMTEMEAAINAAILGCNPQAGLRPIGVAAWACAFAELDKAYQEFGGEQVGRFIEYFKARIKEGS